MLYTDCHYWRARLLYGLLVSIIGGFQVRTFRSVVLSQKTANYHNRKFTRNFITFFTWTMTWSACAYPPYPPRANWRMRFIETMLPVVAVLGIVGVPGKRTLDVGIGKNLTTSLAFRGTNGIPSYFGEVSPLLSLEEDLMRHYDWNLYGTGDCMERRWEQTANRKETTLLLYPFSMNTIQFVFVEFLFFCLSKLATQ